MKELNKRVIRWTGAGAAVATAALLLAPAVWAQAPAAPPVAAAPAAQAARPVPPQVALPPKVAVPRVRRVPLAPFSPMDLIGPDLVELPDLPELPALPELPVLAELPVLPRLMKLPQMPRLAVRLEALQALSRLNPMLVMPLEDEPQSRAEEQKQREEEARQREEERKEREEERKDRINELYEDGSEAIEEGRWDRAIQRFDLVINAGSPRADGAMYWKAYAQRKAGRPSEALATLAQLAKSYPQSRWLGDAKALELEIKQQGGQSVKPDDLADEELKLAALNGLMNMNAEEAVPILEKMLKGGASPKLKQRALFVLAQHNSLRAREAIASIARGQGNPDLQRRALNYIALHGSRESRAVLSEVYAATGDVGVKRTIINGWMLAGERDRLLTAAKGEPNPDLRSYAINQLGVMGAHHELWQLYGSETSVDVKKRILNAMFVGGNTEKLVEIAKSEKNPELRKAAIHSIGLTGRGGDALAAIYTSDPDRDVRKQVLNALFLQDNAKVIVDLARKETDPELKKSAVHWLSLMNNKEAIQFLMELLNKP
jgi:hypothetical protein